jgi:hypothetical protein
MKTITIRILGNKGCQRYSIARSLVQARSGFESQHPDFRLDVQEVTTTQEILHYTPVFAYPSLMIGDRLVCVGRFPSSREIRAWLEDEALREPA